jgi:VanZ family protein
MLAMRIPVPPPAWLRALCLAAFIAMLVQIFFLPRPPGAAIAWDKLLHAGGYGVTAFFLWVAIGFQAPWLNWLAITAIGALDEFRQIFIPTRSADVLDVAADAAGAALVTFVLHRLKKK